MVMCWSVGCRHYSEVSTCRFCRFPKDPKIKKKWIELIRREDSQPTANSVVCSCHFVDGEKSNLPAIHEWNKEKFFKFRSPEKRKQRKREETSVAMTPRQLFSVEGTAAQETTVASTADLAKPSTSLQRLSLDEPSTSTQPSDESRSSSGLRHHLEGLMLEQKGSALQEAELYFLKQENSELKAKLEKLSLSFSFEHIQNNDQLIHMYTGMCNKYLFDTLYELLENIPIKYYAGWTVASISRKDQLLLTLMKLRRNLLYMDLECRFNITSATISNIFNTWVRVLHEILFQQLMETIPSLQKNKLCMPACFSVFSNCRIVLDCTEMQYVKPKALDKQKLTYSSYKHRNTVKGLIGVAPNGVITYVSDLYPGSISDKKIVQDCGVLAQMEPGDLILADKGFLIKDLLPAGVNLNLPPFLSTPQFTREQAIQTRTIARARIHVERAIRRLKCFSILQNIPSTLASQASMIFQVCGALTNFQFPLIVEVENLYGNVEE